MMSSIRNKGYPSRRLDESTVAEGLFGGEERRPILRLGGE